jgi:hypothetical protein
MRRGCDEDPQGAQDCVEERPTEGELLPPEPLRVGRQADEWDEDDPEESAYALLAEVHELFFWFQVPEVRRVVHPEVWRELNKLNKKVGEFLYSMEED